MMKIAEKSIKGGLDAYIIAEAGVNHNGNIDLAFQLVDVSIAAGADAVKFQIFDADKLTTADAPKAEYQKGTTGKTGSQQDMLKSLELNYDDHKKIKDYCDTKGITYLATPFDMDALQWLLGIDTAAIKIGSGDLTFAPLLVAAAQSGRPVMLSTGMANLAEVAEAVALLRSNKCKDFALFQCVSCYPAQLEECNLAAMITLRENFLCPVGFSDHTLGIDASVAATHLGAALIEKHITLSNTMPGPDHSASLEPGDFKKMVTAIRNRTVPESELLSVVMGDGVKAPIPREAEVAAAARRSIVAAKDLKADEVIALDGLAFKRPGTGLSPMTYENLIGKKLLSPVNEGSRIKLSDVI